MIDLEAKKEIQNLIDMLNYYSDLYYNKSTSLISDYEFDMLMEKLLQLEKKYPEYTQPNSPTKKVREGVSKNFKQLSHTYPMLSLSNTYSEEEINSFYNRCCKLLNTSSIEMFCELKCDGVAISLIYENGILINAITRGDGVQGDDITQNALNIKAIPQKIEISLKKFEVRGEIFMTRKQFEKLNNQRLEDGELPWANPRNLTSGTIKLLNPEEVRRRNLDFYPYTLITTENIALSQENSLSTLEKWGFHVSKTSKKCKNQKEVLEYIDLWKNKKNSLPMDIDGIVIKVNNLAEQQVLGATSHSPRWAVAYKYKPEHTQTELITVSYQIGRTGAITPVANFKAVELAGSIIRRASLYNQNFLQNLDLHDHDTIFIEKGGDIIPKVTSINLSKRRKNSNPVKFPIHCPECNSTLHRNEFEAIHYCLNSNNCIPQVKARISHFVSKNAMNIDSIGNRTIDVLFEKNLIKNFTDLYKLTYDEIICLNGFKHQSTENMLQGITKSKTTPFAKVIYALGIKHVGEIAANLLAKYFKNIDLLINASLEELEQIDDIGIKTAMSIKEFLSDPNNLNQIYQLKDYGVNFSLKEEISLVKETLLSNQNFVISGIFENFEREELKALITNLGGNIISSISKKTTYLLAGSNAGESKLQKAKELNISIISEQEFEEIITPAANS